jgi:hypothetical protein
MVGKVVLILLFLVATGLVVAYMYFDFMVDKEIDTLYADSSKDNKIITEEMLVNLPTSVQRYLRYSGVVGKPWINTVRLKQTGQMKPSPQGEWFPFIAEEYYSVNPPRFIWHVWAPRKWLPIIHGRDAYENGKGQLLIKLVSLFPIANAEGEELNQGAMMRYLNEMMWFPTAFLGDNISWKAIDENSAQVTLTVDDKSDDQGKLVNFIAKRYMSNGTGFSLETWETPLSDYGEVNGFNLPIKGSAVWKLPGGDYTYIDISIDEITYN